MPRVCGYEQKVHLPWVKSLSRLGLTQEQIAKELAINVGTLKRWMQKHPRLRTAIKDGKGPADSKVANTLLKRALGYTVIERKSIVELAPDGTQRPMKVEEVKKHVAPDTASMIFWLKNRRPDLWREKVEHQLGTKDEKPLPLELGFDPAKYEQMFKNVIGEKPPTDERADAGVSTGDDRPEPQVPSDRAG